MGGHGTKSKWSPGPGVKILGVALTGDEGWVVSAAGSAISKGSQHRSSRPRAKGATGTTLTKNLPIEAKRHYNDELWTAASKVSQFTDVQTKTVLLRESATGRD